MWIFFIWFLDFLIYISNVISFLSFQSINPLSHPPSPCFYNGVPPPIHSFPTSHPNIPLHWGIKPWQDQGLILPLVPNKAILCYICNWSHGSVHVCFLGGGLVPVSSGWLVFLFFLWNGKLLQLLQSFHQLLHWGPCSCQWLAVSIPLYLSCSGRASQEHSFKVF